MNLLSVQRVLLIGSVFALVFHIHNSSAETLIPKAIAPVYPWADTKSQYGIEKRIPFLGSHVAGSPEALPPYVSERLFPNLRFDRSLELVNGPDDTRWFVCEDPGLVYSFPKESTVERADLFLDIRRKDARYLNWMDQRRIWSIAFHPKFLTNGYVYVCYLDPKPNPQRCRISRFTVDMKNVASPPACDPDTEYIVLEWISEVDHHGGCLRFGPDGYLYFSAGEGSAGYDAHNTGQDITDLNGSILRIDVNRTVNGKGYAIPDDNPFVNVPKARAEVWAYGLRNVWKMNFDRTTGDLWAGDVGQDLYDMINHIEKGGNYGWSILEGTHPLLPERKVGPTPILAPAAEHDHSEVRSVTAGYTYHGSRLKELNGRYIYGDFETGRVYSFLWDGKKASKPELIAQTNLRLVGFAEDNEGELFLLDYQGTVNRLVVRPPSKAVAQAFPKLLSETGLFASTKENTAAPGLIPYNVNAPLWSDGALKQRFIALPPDSKIEFLPVDAWQFPEGAVLVKTFSMEMKTGDPASVRRLETRLLHFEEGQWRFYTYIWNEEQTDAVLLGKDALDRELTIADPAVPGGVRRQTWHFPSRAECILCHNQAPGFVLGLNTPQMNRDFNYGVVDNQLRTLAHIGVFKHPIADFYKRSDTDLDAPLPRVMKLADPQDKTATLEDRSRSYLHANCAHCHRFYGGGTASFNLLITNPLKANRIVDAPATKGDFGIADARLIAPGHPERSMILQRMNKVGAGRMPQIASTVIDAEDIKLIGQWIADMRNSQAPDNN